ncbi:hypothetical protein [Streptomyces resistomycificus]|uniref:Uncharacterized protein n=1 Tax=Streptomyces resistomycificus TaxID=67356 RepID=A0A0L8L5M6_9ACTN|nr:hypothetical protein [Streptomyces resistomycificus]KOG33452.1 hypothetical protein ADK37_22485 [Streptomyces resistomycificus]KUO00935.1 hypothetical protein AQJ84_08140 [Streptomyces resistomycificus]
MVDARTGGGWPDPPPVREGGLEKSGMTVTVTRGVNLNSRTVYAFGLRHLRRCRERVELF